MLLKDADLLFDQILEFGRVKGEGIFGRYIDGDGFQILGPHDRSHPASGSGAFS